MKVKPGIIRDIERGCAPEIDTIRIALVEMQEGDRKMVEGLRRSKRSTGVLVLILAVAFIVIGTWAINATGGAPLEVQSVHVAGGAE